MINEVTGDITLTKAQALAHGIAANDQFGEGLALTLRDTWPALAKDFRQWALKTHPKPGDLWTWGGAGGPKVINLLTQEGDVVLGGKPGRSSLANVTACVKRLRQEVEKQKFRSLALTKLATGAGGMDWKVVAPLYQRYLGDLSIPIYVYVKYTRGLKATEPA